MKYIKDTELFKQLKNIRILGLGLDVKAGGVNFQETYIIDDVKKIELANARDSVIINDIILINSINFNTYISNLSFIEKHKAYCKALFKKVFNII